MTAIRSTQTVAQVAYTGSPTIRSTQTVAQVAYSEVGKLRVTQFYIKILYTPSGGTEYTESVTSTLSLTSTASVTSVLNQTTTSTLAITQIIVGGGVFSRSADNELTDLDEAVSVYINRRIGNTLALVQIVGLETEISRSLASALALVSTVSYVGDRSLSLSVALALTQTLVVSRTLPVKTVSSTLSISDATNWSRPVSNVLNIQQTASGVIGFLTDDAISTLSLVSTANIKTVLVRPLTSVLAITQTASKTAYIPLTTSSTLFVKQDAYIFNRTDNNYVLLQAPVGAIEAAIVLPNAELGDTENLVSDLDLKIAMDGTKRTYLRTNNDHVLKYTFRMNRLRGLAMLEFVEQFGSDLLRLTNWKGEVWHVYLTTNPVEFSETSRGSPCGANTDVDLEFTGVKISG